MTVGYRIQLGKREAIYNLHDIKAVGKNIRLICRGEEDGNFGEKNFLKIGM